MREHEKARILADRTIPAPDYSPIREALGDLMPDLPPGARGRHRLVLALTQRFGENFRMNGKARELLAHFEDESAHIRTHIHLRLGKD